MSVLALTSSLAIATIRSFHSITFDIKKHIMCELWDIYGLKIDCKYCEMGQRAEHVSSRRDITTFEAEAILLSGLGNNSSLLRHYLAGHIPRTESNQFKQYQGLDIIYLWPRNFSQCHSF